MDRRLLRFVSALVIFVVWVASLGALAALSGRSPSPRTSSTAPR